MIGIGSRPESAMRPANTETKPPGPSASQLAACSTWDVGHQRRDVHLDPVVGERSARRPPIGSPRVVVIGTFT